MAIKGLSDIRRLPRAGKIHLGIKKTNEAGNDYPAKVDYFVLPDDRPDLKEILGEKPRDLSIRFPVEDKDLIAPQWYKRYGSGSSRPLCRGDGETAICAVVAKDPKTGKMAPTGELEEIECSGRDCEHYQSKHCRHTMNLMFILEQVVDGGVFQLDTSSFHSIVNFNSSWDYIRALTGGRIAMVPLKLRLIPKEVTPPSGKKLVYVLELCLAERMSLSAAMISVTTRMPTVARMKRLASSSKVKIHHSSLSSVVSP